MSNQRRILLETWQHVIGQLDPRALVKNALRRSEWQERELAVLAIGKAAPGMMQGALDALGDRVTFGIVAGNKPDRQIRLPAHIACFAGGHPVPDEDSLVAGRAVEAALADASRRWIVLVSGGASAALELPRDGYGLPELQAINRTLLASGLPIADINAVRRCYSRSKSGGLLALCRGRVLKQYFIADVPGADISVVSSGPFAPTPIPDIRRLRTALPSLDIPDPLVHSAGLPETELLADNRVAIDTAAGYLESLSMAVQAKHSFNDDVETLARRIVAELEQGGSGAYVYGGESTIVLPDNPGRGGRNQHLALLLAEAIAGSPDITVLCAGTDGIDGNSEDAGAIVDGGTVQRIADAGLNVAALLAGADSGKGLDASGDLLHSGATGTNVMDLVIALKMQIDQQGFST